MAVTQVVRTTVSDQQAQIDRAQYNEANLMISMDLEGSAASLYVLAEVGPRAPQFLPIAQSYANGTTSAIGSLEPDGTGFTVVAATGGTERGAKASPGLAALAARALRSPGFVDGTVATGHGSLFSFALRDGEGGVLYEEMTFGPDRPYDLAGLGGAFSDLQGAVYASTRADPAALVLESSAHLDLTGAVDSALLRAGPQVLQIGNNEFLMVAKVVGPSVGGAAPWVVLVTGVLMALLATVLVEVFRRRRAYALNLVDDRTVALREALHEQARLKDGEEIARQVAESANNAKSEFLSRMSHELRTPLNSVLGFGQLLEGDRLGPDQDESVQQILKAGRHLLDLINEVLDISRIESGSMSMSLEAVEVAEMVSEVLDLVRPLANQRGIALVSALGSTGAHGVDRSTHVQADRQRLKQVLLNLLSNAIKYNRENGTVTVSCTAQGHGWARISVADTGHGIPAAKLDRLFVPFDRLGAEASGVEGTGVGLVLSQRLTEAMGGQLGVATTERQGSCFWVELPVSWTSADLVGDHAPSEDHAARQGRGPARSGSCT